MIAKTTRQITFSDPDSGLIERRPAGTQVYTTTCRNGGMYARVAGTLLAQLVTEDDLTPVAYWSEVLGRYVAIPEN
jgi:TRAP-type uncharacterized transport system substrate-binding protein